MLEIHERIPELILRGIFKVNLGEINEESMKESREESLIEPREIPLQKSRGNLNRIQSEIN